MSGNTTLHSKVTFVKLLALAFLPFRMELVELVTQEFVGDVGINLRFCFAMSQFSL